jgi:hypothetical protein
MNRKKIIKNNQAMKKLKVKRMWLTSGTGL